MENKQMKCVKGESCLHCGSNYCRFVDELDQLKVDREQALKQLEFVRTLNTVKETEIRKLSKTITEIKEIAETEIECKTYEIENDCFNETRCKALNEHIDFIKQILQKISECEVENEYNTSIYRNLKRN